MSFTRIPEQGNYFSYALLSLRVAEVLDALSPDKSPNKEEKRILSQGRDLLSRIREGALLIEGKQFSGMTPTHESLHIYEHALYANHELNVGSKEELSLFFSKLMEEIKNLIEPSRVPNKKLISFLASFFDLLGNSFRKELQKNIYKTQGGPFLQERGFCRYI